MIKASGCMMRNISMPPHRTARLLLVGILALLVVCVTEARNTGAYVERNTKTWQGVEPRGRQRIANNRVRRRLEGKGGGKGDGKGEGKGDSSTTSGSSTSSGSGSGSNSATRSGSSSVSSSNGGGGSSSSSSSSSGNGVSSNTWVGGKYYGCLALTQEERAQMRSSGGYLACDYTKHVVLDTSNGNAASNSTNSTGRSKTKKSSSSQVIANISDSTDPYNAFDIQQCDSYEHLWTWDLQMSCGSTSNYEDCQCTFAQTLMEKGQLSCDDAKNCPKGCSICSSCLRLLGCSSDTVTAGSESASGVAASAAVFTLLVGTGFCLFWDRRKKRKRGKLNDHLIDENSEEPQDRIWMVPIDAGVPTENGSSMRPVWLAPDATTASCDDDSSVASTSLDTKEEYSSETNEDGVEPSTLRQKQWLEQSRWDKNLFPDVLSNGDNPQQPRRVPTIPTDKTSHSDGSQVHDNLKDEANMPTDTGDETDAQSEPLESASASSQSTNSGSWIATISASPYEKKALRAIMLPQFQDAGSASEYSTGSDSNSSTLTNSLECEEDSI